MENWYLTIIPIFVFVQNGTLGENNLISLIFINSHGKKLFRTAAGLVRPQEQMRLKTQIYVVITSKHKKKKKLF